MNLNVDNLSRQRHGESVLQTPDFKQRRYLRKREYWFEETGVEVRESSGVSSRKYHVYFEHIPPKSEEVTTGSFRPRAYAIILMVCAGSCVPFGMAVKESLYYGLAGFWMVLALFAAGIFLAARATWLVFATQERAGLWVYRTRPSSEAVSEFISELFRRRNAHLCARYGQFDGPEPVDEKLRRLEYLRSQEAIENEQYDELRSWLLNRPSTSGPCGFAQ